MHKYIIIVLTILRFYTNKQCNTLNIGKKPNMFNVVQNGSISPLYNPTQTNLATVEERETDNFYINFNGELKNEDIKLELNNRVSMFSGRRLMKEGDGIYSLSFLYFCNPLVSNKTKFTLSIKLPCGMTQLSWYKVCGNLLNPPVSLNVKILENGKFIPVLNNGELDKNLKAKLLGNVEIKGNKIDLVMNAKIPDKIKNKVLTLYKDKEKGKLILSNLEHEELERFPKFNYDEEEVNLKYNTELFKDLKLNNEMFMVPIQFECKKKLALIVVEIIFDFKNGNAFNLKLGKNCSSYVPPVVVTNINTNIKKEIKPITPEKVVNILDKDINKDDELKVLNESSYSFFGIIFSFLFNLTLIILLGIIIFLIFNYKIFWKEIIKKLMINKPNLKEEGTELKSIKLNEHNYGTNL